MQRPLSMIRSLFWQRSPGRLRAPFRIVAHLLALLAMALLGRLAVSAAPTLFSGGLGRVILPLVDTLAVVALTFFFARAVDRRSPAAFGFDITLDALLDLTFGTLLCACLMAAMVLIEIQMGWATYAYRGRPWSEWVSGVGLSAWVFLSVAFVEETISRAYHLWNLTEGLQTPRLPPWAPPALAVLISSALFGLAHAGNPHATTMSIANIALAGLFLASAYIYTGKMALPIGLHLGWNFFQNLFGMPVSGMRTYFDGALLQRQPQAPQWLIGGDFGPEGGLLGALAMLIGTLGVLAWIRLRRGSLTVEIGRGSAQQ